MIRNAHRCIGLLCAASGVLIGLDSRAVAGTEAVWTYTPAGPVTPPSNTGGWTIWDPRHECFVHHPGQHAYTGPIQHRSSIYYPGGTYRWEPDSRRPWTRLAIAPDLPPLERAAAVYDSATNAIWVFGGKHTTYSIDTYAPATTVNTSVWRLELDSVAGWQVAAVSGPAPSPRFDASLVLDSARHRLLVFGGADTLGGEFEDVWSLDLDGAPAWHELHASGSPEARSGHAAAYDRRRDRMIVACGEGTGGAVLADTWALELGDSLQWRRLDPVGEAPLGSVAGAMDESRDRWIVVSHGAPIRVSALSLSDPPAWQPVAAARRAPEWAESNFIIPRISAAWDPAHDALAVLWPMGVYNGVKVEAPLLRFGPLPVVNITAQLRSRDYKKVGTNYTYWSVSSDRPLYDLIGIVMTQSDEPAPTPASLWEFPDTTGSILFRQDGATRTGRYIYRVHWFDGVADRDTGDFSVGPTLVRPIAIAGLSNPARGSIAFTLQLNDELPARVDVYDITGRLRFRRTLQGNGSYPVSVAARGWPAGVYFVNVTHVNDMTVRAVAFMP